MENPWIKLEEKRMPLETPIFVKHKYGVDAIQYWNAAWRFWYSGSPVGIELLELVSHWCNPKNIQL